jgi:putative serine protease PepD
MLLRKSTATFLAGAAVLGGAVGGGAVVAVANGGGSTTTTITAAAPAATASTVSTTGNASTVYRRASGSVVQITAVSTGSGSGGGGDGAGSNPFAPGGGEGGGGAEATGTGFVIDAKGLIVTNEHVIDGAGKITVTLQDGTDIKATLVGKDASTDLALLRIDPGSHALPALTLGDDSGLTIGQDVYAIGSPYALQGTLTTGVISQLHRQITSPNGFSISDAIQTDAELNPGNSGGPLLDASGQVIGVNAQVYGGSQSASGEATGGTGLGFAIPSSTVKRVVSQLSEGGTIQHAYLGVGIADGTGTTGGAKLGSVLADGPAGKAGLKAGDVVTQIGTTKISGADDLADAISSLSPGDKVAVKITRDGAAQTVQVTLGTQPAQATS